MIKLSMPSRFFKKKRVTCIKCGAPLDGGSMAYCKAHHAEEMRRHRAKKKAEFERFKEFYNLHNGQ